ncbi:uncharacterized protein LOC142634633 [Castanea sativa]|uniref:uncharacterized protein LOC142634633 n=1 Tax=Castanea sativa TaxID=21020 RepID=UPI003F651206
MALEILDGNKGGPSTTNYLKGLIFEFGVVDLGCLGNKYTWAKGRWGNVAIKRRLDRGIASIPWRLASPKASIAHLGAINSNHTPILLDNNPKDNFAHRPFRFEAVKVRDNGCNAIVKKAWNEEVSGSAMVRLCKKQATTRDTLRKWNKEVFGHYQDSINRLLSKIAEVQSGSQSMENERIESNLLVELLKWLVRSEILWKKKSRELWLKEGDKNNKFFHLSTTICRRQNRIDAIKQDDGTWVTSSNQIREHFLNSFKDLFREEEVSFPNNLDNLISPCITKAENSILSKIPTPEEIKSTLFNMHDKKAPRLDGFLALFYKEFWPIVGDVVTKAVTSFFCRRKNAKRSK